MARIISFLRHHWVGLGSLPANRVKWTLVIGFSVWVLMDLFFFKVSGGLNDATYDGMVRGRIHAAAPDPRIVIVDIDEASLSRMSREFGRWPWPRDTLAVLLDYLESQQPAAVVWDIVFADPDRLNPGGDAAFDASARRSQHSHFPVTRLPAANDNKSRVTRAELPGLWWNDGTPSGTATVAMIAPFLPGVATSPRLGFNNGYPDGDGTLRRYRYTERLSSAERIQATAASVVRSVAPERAAELPAGDTLMAWRAKDRLYPRVSFADVFARAEGNASAQVPSFAGKVVVIGSTAPSLYDVHASPMRNNHPGVDILATAIDNGLNGHFLAELPVAVQAVLAIATMLLLVAWIDRYGVSSLDAAVVGVPGALMALSYLSLNGAPFFLDLSLSAGLALLFLTVFRTWIGLQRWYWQEVSSNTRRAPSLQLESVWALRGAQPFAGRDLDRLIALVASEAPRSRVLAGDGNDRRPVKLVWPELANYVAVVGPLKELQRLREKAFPIFEGLTDKLIPVSNEGASADQARDVVCQVALQAWGELAQQSRNSNAAI